MHSTDIFLFGLIITAFAILPAILVHVPAMIMSKQQIEARQRSQKPES